MLFLLGPRVGVLQELLLQLAAKVLGEGATPQQGTTWAHMGMDSTLLAEFKALPSPHSPVLSNLGGGRWR